MSGGGPDPAGLYQPVLMRHARRPARRGRLAPPAREAHGVNRPCGDRLLVSVAVDDVVRAIRFEGEGCALCLAAASALCDAIEGLPIAAARAVGEALTAAVRSGEGEVGADLPGDLAAFLPARAFPARHGCVTLAADLVERLLCEASALG